jgi:PKD repeat protein
MSHLKRHIVSLCLVAFIAIIGGNEATAQTTQPAPPEPPAFTILPNSGMAPCVVHVNATAVPLARGTPLTARYEWDFGDPGGRFSTLAGWTAAHVYDLPGQYTLRLAITDETGAQQTTSQTINVIADARRTVFVAADGSDANNTGADPARPLRSLAAAMKQLKPGTKILLRRGDTFDIATTLQLNQPNVVLAAYSTAPPTTTTSPSTQPADDRPLVRIGSTKSPPPIIRVTSSASDVVIQDLVFDTADVKGTGKEGAADAVRISGPNCAVRNCRFLNLTDAVNCNARPRGVLVQDCDVPGVTNIRGYFAWIEGADFVLLGNRCPNSTREHIIRIGGADRLNISFNNFANVDRRTRGDQYDIAKGAIVVHLGSWAYIANNTVPGGPIGIGPLGGGDGLKDPGGRFRWCVVENNQSSSNILVVHGSEHTMVRNNVVRRNDWVAFTVEGFDERYQRGCIDVTLANNTGINNSDKGSFLHVTGAVDGLTVINNLYVAPKLAPGNAGAAPLRVASDARTLDGRIRLCSHNVWPACAQNGSTRGINYVGPAGSNKPPDYLTPKAWLQLPQVEDDVFENVTLDEKLCPNPDSIAISHGVPVPGVPLDTNGRPRPPRAITVGAVQCAP